MNTSLITSGGLLVKGPNKDDLEKAIFDNQVKVEGLFPPPPTQPERKLTFTTDDGQLIDILPNSIAREDGSGESWLIGGYVIGKEVGNRIEVYWHTATPRKGHYTIHYPEKYREGKLYGLPQNVKVGDCFELRFHGCVIPYKILITKLETRNGRILAQALAEDDLGEDSEWWPVNLTFDPGGDHAELNSYGLKARDFTLMTDELPETKKPWTVRLLKLVPNHSYAVEVDVQVDSVARNGGEHQFVTGSIPGSMTFVAEIHNALSPTREGCYQGCIRLKSCFD